jgi:uncharacterized membrane protein
MSGAAVLLGLLAALCYGASDFMGGVGGRRASVGGVVLAQQPFALLATVIVWALYRSSSPTAAVLGWGALSGLGNCLGTVSLYRGLAVGRMSVVASLSALLAALIPAAVGIGLGEQLSALEAAGMILAGPAIVLVSLNAAPEVGRRSGIWEGLAAGVGFGLLFVALDRAGTASGAWPLLPGQAVSLSVAIPLGLRMSRENGHRREAVPYGAAAGVLGALAVVSFLVATGQGNLSLVAVLTALYPAVTIVLARVVLSERWSRVQGAGLLAAAASVVLISVGSGGS